MSIDHKPDMPAEKARIERAGSMIVEGRVNGNINLSRSIGDLEYKESHNLGPEEQAVTAFPEVKQTEIGPDDDFLILACDGIWDVLTS
jgi:serine/threonine protein phosphatase PrpC